MNAIPAVSNRNTAVNNERQNEMTPQTEAVIYPGVYAKAVLLRSKNTTKKRWSRNVRSNKFSKGGESAEYKS